MDELQTELEKPMKVYQGKALENKIDNITKMLTEQNIFMKGVVTADYMHEQMKSLEEKIHNRYDPTLNNTRWVAKTAIGAFVSIILVVIGIYLKS